MKLPQLDSNNLFIFTDASVTKYGRHEEEYISCSGAVACVWTGNCYQIIDQSFVINRCSTNNNGEIKAIYYGLLLALKYKNNFRTINLLSDSKISIYGLREWIEGWVQNSKGDQLLGSTNEPVSSQQEILACIYTIMTNDLHVKLYHQKGHCTRRVMSVAFFCIAAFFVSSSSAFSAVLLAVSYSNSALRRILSAFSTWLYALCEASSSFVCMRLYCCLQEL